MRAVLLVLSFVMAPFSGDLLNSNREPETVLVTLSEGRSFEGQRLGVKGDLILYQTPFGLREVEKDMIIAERAIAVLEARYRSELNALGELDLEERERLARWCLAQGFDSALAEHLDALLAKDPRHPWAWHVVKELAPLHRITERNPQPEGKGRWDRTQVDLTYRALRDGNWLKGAIARVQLDSLPLDAQVNASVQHAERGRELQRWVAVQTLTRAEPVRRVRTLYKTVLSDVCWQVRLMALQSLQDHDDGTTYRPLTRALLKQGNNDVVRMNAAWALGYLGDRRAVAPLVRAMKATTDIRSAHANISQLSQVAYVKDYDVEVAQTAFIADPVVDVVLDGFVLDVAIVSLNRQRDIISGALNRLTAADLPAASRPWTDWWQKKGEEFMASVKRE